jgi:hypothetical protein
MRKINSLLLFILSTLSGLNVFAQHTDQYDYRDSTITVAASNVYHAHFFWRVFFGNHYRAEWTTPVNVRYLDIRHQQGGLTPVKLGGGFQTKSLQLKGADSILYVIRTIDKDPSKVLDSSLREGMVSDVVRDQISASHPYGSLVVPLLAKAARIYHTNPQLFYVPDDPALGEYRDIFKHKMVILEEHDLTNDCVEPALKGFRDVVSTEKVEEELRKSSNNFVDERMLLRSRLFDMMIGDWDRHQNQWMWAVFDNTYGGEMFRPIPRDRDQVFFNFDGVIPKFASESFRKVKKMQSFKPMPRSVKWFNHNARFFDQKFLSRMTKDECKQIADSLVNEVSDNVIDSAFRAWPDPIYRLSSEPLSKILKKRRNNLPRIAEKYFRYLAKTVKIEGTDSSEFFEVIRSFPDQAEVNVYQYHNGSKARRIYHRTFSYSETEELSLYGLGDDDVYEISGEAKRGPVINIADDKEKSIITDHSVVKNLADKTRIKDPAKENEEKAAKEKH